MPIPSTMSRVRRNGTISGVLRKRPCSNATPRSMWTTLAVRLWMRMLELCRSPSPMTWPAAAFLAIKSDQGHKGHGELNGYLCLPVCAEHTITGATPAAVKLKAQIMLRHGDLSLVWALRQLLPAWRMVAEDSAVHAQQLGDAPSAHPPCS